MITYEADRLYEEGEHNPFHATGVAAIADASVASDASAETDGVEDFIAEDDVAACK